MRKIVTWEGINVSALRTQRVSNDVYWVVTLAQCQLVRWLLVINLWNRNRPTLNLCKKKERLLVSLFVLSFFLSELHFPYYATKVCEQPRQFLPYLRRSCFFNTKTPINTDGERIMNAVSVAKSETKTKNGLHMYVVSLVLQFYMNG